MAKRRVTRRNLRAAPVDMSKVRVESEWIDINDVKPYEYNARDNSKAIEAVANSIRAFGFIVPIVIDDDYNLAAGHTRIEAAKLLGMPEVLAVRANHLNTDQIDAFRLIDNKVAEIADWDTELLGQELARLDGIVDFTDYGWSQDEIDCLSQVVAADCLSGEGINTSAATEEREVTTTRRGPQSTRLVLGEFVIFIPTTVYRDWLDGMHRYTNYNKSELEAEIKNRLGIVE